MTSIGQREPLLRFQSVSVSYTKRGQEPEAALTDFSTEIFPGEVLALVGESGSGKSTAGFAAAGLLPENARPTGIIQLGKIRLPTVDSSAFHRVRGRKIGFVFQEPGTALHPAMRIQSQIAEALHPSPSQSERKGRVCELLQSVRLDPTRALLKAFPHHLSGGMQQRVVLAMALANQPDVVVADEPTTALDPTIRKGILELLRSHATDQRKAVLLITHDLGIVSHFADRVAVLRAGRLVETGPRNQILRDPRHEYTQSLLESARLTAGVPT